MKFKNKKIIVALLFFSLVYTKEDDPVSIGNLSLPTSQQPGPLFCLGQNIVDKGNFQSFIYTDWQNGFNKRFNEIIPQFLYGISDSLSLFVSIPIATQFKINNCPNYNCSRGIEDMYVQLEYAYYTKENMQAVTQATVVANITFPTGSITKNPRLGNGSVSFLLALTASHMATDWYYFISGGAQITTTKNNIKFGNEFYYQGGIGRNIDYIPNGRIITLLLESFGIYSQKNRAFGIINPMSGGNVFYIGPSLWISTSNFIFSTGIAFPIVNNDKEFGNNNYYYTLEVGYKFN